MPPAAEPAPAAPAAPELPEGLFADAPGEPARCFWCRATPLYRHYHDHEWGFPVSDDRRLFEKLCLEGFQAGLSWITILNKREAFRAGFANFDAERMADFGGGRGGAPAGRPGHRAPPRQDRVGHPQCAPRAGAAARIRQPGALCVALRAGRRRGRPERLTLAAARSLTTAPAAVALSKDLKKRGFGFVGPTTMYAFMQAMGLVNDHIEGCATREAALAARAAFQVPGPAR